jgi:hypothetical protein
MDTRGARHLTARLAVGAAVGERVEVAAVAEGPMQVRPGDKGTLLSIDEGVAGVLFDSGATVSVDLVSVRLRPVSPRAT